MDVLGVGQRLVKGPAHISEHKEHHSLSRFGIFIAVIIDCHKILMLHMYLDNVRCSLGFPAVL